MVPVAKPRKGENSDGEGERYKTGDDVILKATKVDGIYDKDPHKDPTAVKFSELSYFDVICKKLSVMDATAITMCMEADIPIRVFKLGEAGCVWRAVTNEKEGTLVHG